MVGKWKNAVPVYLFATIFSIHSAAATTHTVKKDGTGDFTSINDAITAAWSGDTIIVYPGVYTEEVYLANKDLMLHSSDPTSLSIITSTIIDGNSSHTPVSFGGSETPACIVRGFTIRNSSHLRAGIYGSWSGATIINNIIRDNYDGIRHCKGVIRNCIIRDNSSRGLYECDADVENNTIVGNNGGGIYDTENHYVRNCIIWGNAMPQVAACNLHPQYCCIQDVSFTNCGVGNIYANPEFVSQQDLELTSLSPCINKGMNMPWMIGATDLAGNSRIINGTVDMGAYEYLPEPSALTQTLCLLGFAARLSYRRKYSTW